MLAVTHHNRQVTFYDSDFHVLLYREAVVFVSILALERADWVSKVNGTDKNQRLTDLLAEVKP